MLRTRTPTLSLAGLALAVVLAACAAAGEPPAPGGPAGPVRALRYRIVWAESGLDLSHGGGQWVEEIWFPDRRVACTFRQAWEWPVIDAFPAEAPRNDLTGLHGAPPSAMEEVEVPRDLADAIFAQADLTARWREGRTRVGARVVESGVLREVPEPERWATR